MVIFVTDPGAVGTTFESTVTVAPARMNTGSASPVLPGVCPDVQVEVLVQFPLAPEISFAAYVW